MEWDWCLYETGFFAGSHEPSNKRLVCLHRAGVELPGPLQAWEAVTEEHCDALDEISRKPAQPGAKPLYARIASNWPRAVTDRNLDQQEIALNGMRDVNRDELRLIAHRFSELIDELQ